MTSLAHTKIAQFARERLGRVHFHQRRLSFDFYIS